jgi:hypothetical protein
MTADLLSRAQKAAHCIYIAVEKPVADDIADIIIKLADRIAKLERERDGWKSEAQRLRAAKPLLDQMAAPQTVSDVIQMLEEHRWTHTDWATWFEANPHDNRAKDLGCADFHRKVEARYTAAILCLQAAEARVRELEEALRNERERCARQADYYVEKLTFGSIARDIATTIRALPDPAKEQE